MTKINTVLLLVLCCFSFPLLFGQDVAKAFITMPDPYYLSLPSHQRKEMVKAFYSDSVQARKNRFMGESVILQLDTINNFIRIKNSNNGRVDFKVVKSNLSEAVYYYVLIFTACAPVCDSDFGFYDANWNFKQNLALKKVQISDFLNEDAINADGQTVESVSSMFDIVFVELHFPEAGNTLEAVLNSQQFMDNDSFDRLRKYLNGDKLRYAWKNDVFVKEACYW